MSFLARIDPQNASFGESSSALFSEHLVELSQYFLREFSPQRLFKSGPYKSTQIVALSLLLRGAAVEERRSRRGHIIVTSNESIALNG